MFRFKDLITLANLFLGFWAIISFLEGDLSLGTKLIFAAVFADGMDGFVSRRFFKPTKFGKELDSLADMVSFCVAPALLISRIIVPNGFGVVVAIFVVCMGAIRLARYNVEGGRHPKYFSGLPVPMSALMIVTYYNSAFVQGDPISLLFFLAIGLLNVSEFKYPSQKRSPTIGNLVPGFLLLALLLYYVKEGLMWEYLSVLSIIYLFSPLLVEIKPVLRRKKGRPLP